MKNMSEREFIALDGGWGWLVVCGAGLGVVFLLPMTQVFSMIYGKTFEELGISATEMSIILSVNQAFGFMLALTNVPLLRNYGYRNIALIGQILYSSGIILTSFATCFIHFIITYGMITSLGATMIGSANMLAINTYFKEKRGQAVGVYMFIAGSGQIFVPQISSLILSIYNSQGTILILGGMSLNHVIGGLLLHPIEWHTKRVDNVKDKAEKFKTGGTNNTFRNKYTIREMLIADTETKQMPSFRKNSQLSIISDGKYNDDNIITYEYEAAVVLKDNCAFNVEQDWFRRNSSLRLKVDKTMQTGNVDYILKESESLNGIQLNKINFISTKFESSAVVNKNEKFKRIGDNANANNEMRKLSILGSRGEDAKEPGAKAKSLLTSSIQQLAMMLDLELLRSRLLVMTFLCLSFIIFVEMSFSNLMPLILDELSFDRKSIATMLSVLGIADLVFRGLAPSIGQWLRQPPMAILFFSLAMILISRMVLIFINTYVAVLIISISLGIAKGFRIVYMNILIATSVPLEKFTTAASIQHLADGCIMFIASPVLGLIKDFSGSYILCIIFLNIVTLLILIMMLGLFITKYVKNRKKLSTFYELEQVGRNCNFDCHCCLN